MCVIERVGRESNCTFCPVVSVQCARGYCEGECVPVFRPLTSDLLCVWVCGRPVIWCTGVGVKADRVRIVIIPVPSI